MCGRSDQQSGKDAPLGTDLDKSFEDLLPTPNKAHAGEKPYPVL
ncbi:hypothetical protein [Izhakiella capsodis]|nr:hypothetical protein [Izhakiella capsodis]